MISPNDPNNPSDFRAWEDWPPARCSELGTCQQCGKQNVLVVKTVDPFDEDVHGATGPKEYWCRPCFDARRDEI